MRFFFGADQNALGIRASGRILALLLCGAFLLRSIVMLCTPGLPMDVACFTGWADQLVREGPGQFYAAGIFADYPPGYLYVLWLMGWIIKLLGLHLYSALGLYLLGLPCLLADLGLAAFLWHTAKPYGMRAQLIVCALCAYSPAFLFNSAVWKQVDAVLILVLCICFKLLMRRHYEGAALAYAVALLVKPQALICGPVFALAFLLEFVAIWNEPVRDKLRRCTLFIARTLRCALLCVGGVWLMALPFRGTQEPFWLLRRYLDTASYYAYASVNASNLMTLLGGNYRPLDEGWLLSYRQWGGLFLLLLTAAALWLGCRALRVGTDAQGVTIRCVPERSNWALLAAFYSLGVFTLLHTMHERYSLPAIGLLLLAYARSGNRRVLWCVLIQTACSLANMVLAFYAILASAESFVQVPALEAGLRMVAVIQLLSFLAVAAVTALEFGNPPGKAAPPYRWSRALRGDLQALDTVPVPRWTKRDTLCASLPTLLSAVLAFSYLGSMAVPETGWGRAGESFQGGILLGERGQEVVTVSVYLGRTNGDLWLQAENGALVADLPAQEGQIYQWHTNAVNGLPDQLEIYAQGAVVNELVFLDAQSQPVAPKAFPAELAPLFDEQHLYPAQPSQLDGMYFDEIYHARAAYEQLEGLPIYENTHPPLGKALISAGIWMFGMNPFGWRFMGALFGVLQVPLLYLLARGLPLSRAAALTGTTLFALDFARFTQSRIATLDVFACFFTLLSALFMLHYLRCDFYKTPLSRQFLLLLGAGVGLGLNLSVKWTGAYAGLGLALVFFVGMFLKGAHKPGRRLCTTLLFCIFAFVVVPALLYVCSYLPYLLSQSDSKSVGELIRLQQYMLGYHADLLETHPFSSPWYEWPLSLRPVWYYAGAGLSVGYTASIALLGNPLVWWPVAVAALLALARIRRDNCGTWFLLLLFAAQYLPWIFISRITFLYHYLAAFPFALLLLCQMLDLVRRSYPRAGYGLFVGICAVAIFSFILFYPVLSGYPVREDYANLLQWLPQWQFYL